MPNIVLRIAIDYRTRPSHSTRTPYNSCHLYLHQPVSAQTAFYILRTPVFVREGIDEYSSSPGAFGMGRTMGDYLALSLFDVGPQPKPPTAHVENKETVTPLSPVLVILSISLYPQAGLHSGGSVDSQQSTFDLTTFEVKIKRIGRNKSSEASYIDTVVELLKLRRTEKDLEPFVASRNYSKPNCRTFGPCALHPFHSDWDVALILRRPCLEVLLERVSPKSISRFILRIPLRILLIMSRLVTFSS